MRAGKHKTTLKGPAIVAAYVRESAADDSGHFRTDIPEALVKLTVWGAQNVLGHDVRPGVIDGVDVALVIIPSSGATPDLDAIGAAFDQLVTDSGRAD